MAAKSNEKLYRRVIDSVLSDIEAGQFPVGCRLPAERELAEVNSVSRTTVREAMVALEMLGYVEMRKGSGIYVISVSGNQGNDADLDIGAFALMEARRIFEAEVASLAARYATAEHLAALEKLLREMENPDEMKAEAADREFHLVVAKATGSGAMVSVVAHLWDLRERAPLARIILGRSRGLGFSARVNEHRAVFDAIQAHDPQAARRAMADHLNRVIEHLLRMTENDDIEAVKRRSASLRERVTLAPR